MRHMPRRTCSRPRNVCPHHTFIRKMLYAMGLNEQRGAHQRVDSNQEWYTAVVHVHHQCERVPNFKIEIENLQQWCDDQPVQANYSLFDTCLKCWMRLAQTGVTAARGLTLL
jgi:hypothetical protein